MRRTAACALAMAFALLSARARADDEDARTASRAAFARGVEQLQRAEWATARASFEEAYRLFPHPSILLNLGLSRLRTGDVEQAERDLSRFLADDPDSSPGELSAARAALGEARASIGTLRVTVSPGPAEVRVEGCGEPLTQASSVDGVVERRCRVGAHDVRVSRAGYAAVARTVTVPAGGTADEAVALAPLDPLAGASAPRGVDTTRAVGWSLAGLSVGAAAVGAYAGIRAIGLASDYKDRSSPSFQDPDVRSDGVTLRTIADVSIVVGVVAAAGAVYLLFLAPRDAPRPEAMLRW